MTEVIYETSIFEEAFKEYRETIYEVIEYFKERYGEFKMDEAPIEIVKRAAEVNGIKLKEVIYSVLFGTKNKDWMLLALVEGD